MSMRSPEEGPRKGLLFFRSTSAPTQERPSGVVMDPPKPHIEVEPEPQFQPQPEPPQTPEPQRTKKSLIRRLAQNLAVRLGFATLALGGSGYAAYQEIPAVHRSVDNVIGKVFGDEVPNTFDNKADSGVVEDNNTIKLSKQETKDRPKADEDGKPILKFNFIPPAGKRIEYSKSFHGGFVHPGVEVDEKTTRNEMNMKIPAGTIITAPMNGRVFIGTDLINGNKKQDGLIIMFMSQDGLLYHLGIERAGGLEDGIFQPLVNAPKRTDANRGGKQWEEGFLASEDQGLFLVTKDVEVSILLQGGLNGTLYGQRVEGNLQFAIASGKLVLPQT